MNECILKYKITEEAPCKAMNHENVEEMKQLLADAGFNLFLEDGILILSANENKKKSTSAGRPKRYSVKDTEKFETYKYSDIVCMMQSMMDKDISEKIKMPIATFYRHKKRMVSSEYYNSLDKNKLDDLAYLQSVDGNCRF